MSAYSYTTEIERRVAAVFAFVTDPAGYIDSDHGPVPFRGTFALEPCAAGTRFTWTVELSGAASRLAGPLVGRATKGELRANSDRLKALLEKAA
jgi:hypothetical protein